MNPLLRLSTSRARLAAALDQAGHQTRERFGPFELCEKLSRSATDEVWRGRIVDPSFGPPVDHVVRRFAARFQSGRPMKDIASLERYNTMLQELAPRSDLQADLARSLEPVFGVGSIDGSCYVATVARRGVPLCAVGPHLPGGGSSVLLLILRVGVGALEILHGAGLSTFGVTPRRVLLALDGPSPLLLCGSYSLWCSADGVLRGTPGGRELARLQALDRVLVLVSVLLAREPLHMHAALELATGGGEEGQQVLVDRLLQGVPAQEELRRYLLDGEAGGLLERLDEAVEELEPRTVGRLWRLVSELHGARAGRARLGSSRELRQEGVGRA